MCYGCWLDARKPKKLPASARRCVDLIKKLYELPHGGVGGNLHIVTDDWNLDLRCIRACKATVTSALEGKQERYVDIDPEQNTIEMEICRLMERMTFSERNAVMALEAGFIDESGRELEAA